MQRLRKLPLLARLVLAWFALSIGVAVASPIFKPTAMELICSGSGAIKVLIKGEDGTASIAGHTLDCPLCASLDSPPEAAPASQKVHPLTHALDPIPAARVAWRSSPQGAPTGAQALINRS